MEPDDVDAIARAVATSADPDGGAGVAPALVSIDEIEASGWDMNIGRYVGVEAPPRSMPTRLLRPISRLVRLAAKLKLRSMLGYGRQGSLAEQWSEVQIADIAEINPESIDERAPPEEISYIDIGSVSSRGRRR